MSYPDIFSHSAVGSLMTSFNPSLVQNDSPLNVSGSLINGSKQLWNDPMTQQEFQTIHRLPFGIPQNVIQDNTVNYEVNHSWTNHRGYGNLINAHLKPDGVISARVAPWNRMPPLTIPYSGPAEGTNAWRNK